MFSCTFLRYVGVVSGPINSFLAHPSWQPLSRLTFSMYLVAYVVQWLYIGAVYTPMYVNHLNQVSHRLIHYCTVLL